MDFFDPVVWDFIVFGLISNVVAIICTFIFTLVKAGNLPERELQKVIGFSKMRQIYIRKYNSGFKIYGAFLMNLVPMYAAVLNAWYLFNLLVIPDGEGIITATIKSDQLALVTLVRYDVVHLKDK